MIKLDGFLLLTLKHETNIKKDASDTTVNHKNHLITLEKVSHEDKFGSFSSSIISLVGLVLKFRAVFLPTRQKYSDKLDIIYSNIKFKSNTEKQNVCCI